MSENASIAIEGLATANGGGLDHITKKIRLKPATVDKILRIYPLFAEDPSLVPREPEIIAFMVEKAFDTFFASGEIEKRLAEIAKNV